VVAFSVEPDFVVLITETDMATAIPEGGLVLVAGTVITLLQELVTTELH
jgi:hypothetical protein